MPIPGEEPGAAELNAQRKADEARQNAEPAANLNQSPGPKEKSSVDRHTRLRRFAQALPGAAQT